jgi:hypothetical protein
MIKSRRMSWTEHVAHMSEDRGAYKFQWEKLRERDYLKDLRVGGDVRLT